MSRLKAKGFFCAFAAAALIAGGGGPFQTGAAEPPPTVIAAVDLNGAGTPISPYIYGINEVDPRMTQRSARLGGNRLTGYNWHNNMSSAGSDWRHYSDDYLVQNIADRQRPGAVITDFALKAAEAGAYSVATLPMAGYVARDGKGPVGDDETAPSERWARVEDRKPGGEFTLEPVRDADVVYTDELLNYLITTLGDSSSDTGIKGYCLDNEPALWSGTHPRIHPGPVTVDELIERTVSLASAVKDMDPGAEVYGPVLYGFGAYNTLQGAGDWGETYKNEYRWFIDCYLDKMREAEETHGRRLLDVLDVHYYSEAENPDGQRICFNNPTDDDSACALMESTRTLWDGDYLEKSWIAQWFSQFLPILPNLKASIDEYYPGTKLALTEYGFGSMHHISGGVAVADALGIFAENGVYLATVWPERDMLFGISAVNMYTNADGEGLAFGDTLRPVTNASPELGSVYASEDKDGNLHLMIISKAVDGDTWFRVNVGREYRIARAFTLEGAYPGIRERDLSPGALEDPIAFQAGPMSVNHLVLTADPWTEPAPKDSPSPAPTPAEPEQPDGWEDGGPGLWPAVLIVLGAAVLFGGIAFMIVRGKRA